jgi:hypothetical protein
MSISKALIAIQSELKAPKNQRNNFGNYNYRSAEDILEAVKPLLQKHEAQLVLTDGVEQVGDRIYIKATAVFLDKDGNEITNSAYARESLDKKGMDDSQITGTASSYARKYCLNGLFLIDDTKDADTDEYKRQTTRETAPKDDKPSFQDIREHLKTLDTNFKINQYAKEIAQHFTTEKQKAIISQIFSDRRAEVNAR